MRRLKVISYNALRCHHVCIDDRGRERRVDLQVDGGQATQGPPEALVGREFDVEHLYPYEEIAAGVTEVKP